MNFADFIQELGPMMNYYGVQHFPMPVLERIHYHCRDLNRAQVKELFTMIFDKCEFAPKVPKFIELANVVRSKYREAKEYAPGDGEPKTEEAGRAAVIQIRSLVNKIGKSI